MVARRWYLKTTPLWMDEVAQDEILEGIAKGMPFRTACLRAGISPSSIESWRQALTEGHYKGGATPAPEALAAITLFMERLELARAEGEAFLVESIYDAVGQKNEKTGVTDINPAKFLLTHGANRKNWYEYHDQPNQVAPSAYNGAEAQRLAAMSDAELIDLAGDEYRELVPPSTP